MVFGQSTDDRYASNEGSAGTAWLHMRLRVLHMRNVRGRGEGGADAPACRAGHQHRALALPQQCLSAAQATSTEAWIYRNRGTREAIVSFRGTSDPQDMMTDACMALAAFSPGQRPGSRSPEEVADSLSQEELEQGPLGGIFKSIKVSTSAAPPHPNKFCCERPGTAVPMDKRDAGAPESMPSSLKRRRYHLEQNLAWQAPTRRGGKQASATAQRVCHLQGECQRATICTVAISELVGSPWNCKP